MGGDGTGSLSVTDQGQVTSDYALIGGGAASIGQVMIDWAGCVWNCGGNLWVGDDGGGTLTIRNDGLVEVGGSAVVDDETTSQGTLAFDIGADGTGLLDIAGSLTIGESSSQQVTVDPRIIPSPGQAYVLVNGAGGISETFSDKVLQGVSGDLTLTWAVHYNPTDITLEVVDVGLYGDGDDDDVDIADFASFQACFTGEGGSPLTAECGYYDSDNDGDADLTDFEALVDVITGPGE